MGIIFREQLDSSDPRLKNKDEEKFLRLIKDNGGVELEYNNDGHLWFVHFGDHCFEIGHHPQWLGKYIEYWPKTVWATEHVSETGMLKAYRSSDWKPVTKAWVNDGPLKGEYDYNEKPWPWLNMPHFRTVIPEWDPAEQAAFDKVWERRLDY
ncbi:MAG: hypothetical protein KDD50_16705 [Bdellovibrionales bacterium]|nr:hypothetical protein [Bdellovibrionales bacterium]